MTFSEETTQLANVILKSSDLGGDFIEHHGVKGQKHGVRRYQNEDGSLTALGRQHYGIFERMRNYFSPASKGYRAAQKQKKIDEKIKYQQKVNELKRLKNESKEEEYRVKQMKREDRDERKARKFDQKMREKELESRERQFNLQQKTMLDIQKQRDTAQAAREQAQREYQTQQEIAKGKTLLGRLQKGAKMVAAISGIAGSGKKIAEAIGIDTSKFVTEWKAKYGDENNETKPEPPKPPKPPKPPNPTTDEPENSKNRLNVDLSGWDPNKQYGWNPVTVSKDPKNRLNVDTSGLDWGSNSQATWSPVKGSKDPKNKLNMDLSGWNPNTQYTWSSGNRQSIKDSKDTKDNDKEKTAIEQQRKRQQIENFFKKYNVRMSPEENEFLKKNNIPFEEWANHIKKIKHYTNPFERILDTDKIFTERDEHFFDQDWRDKQKKLKEKAEKERQERKEAEEKAKGDSHNISNEPPSHAMVDKYKNLLGMAVPTDKKTATEKNRYYSEGKRLSLQDAAEDDGVEGFRNMAKRFTMSPEARRKERQERRERKAAEERAEREALEQAKDIKRRWDNFYKFQQGSQNDSLTKSDTGRFITSASPSKIADILLGKVPTKEYPHISLGKAMDERIGQPTDYRDEFKKRKDWQRKQRFGHDDMQEDAGEIEDAE